jgi:hypothetical protein
MATMISKVYDAFRAVGVLKALALTMAGEILSGMAIGH